MWGSSQCYDYDDVWAAIVFVMVSWHSTTELFLPALTLQWPDELSLELLDYGTHHNHCYFGLYWEYDYLLTLDASCIYWTFFFFSTMNTVKIRNNNLNNNLLFLIVLFHKLKSEFKIKLSHSPSPAQVQSFRFQVRQKNILSDRLINFPVWSFVWMRKSVMNVRHVYFTS